MHNVRMMNEQHIANLIRELAKANGWKVTHASKMASGSGDTVARIEKGIGLTMRRANMIVVNVSKLWPVDFEWPADIPRPPAKKGDTA